MASSQDLRTALLEFCKTVYIQAPESRKLTYPCIMIEKNRINQKFANDKKYMFMNQYTLTFIHKDVDNDTPLRILEQLPYTSFDRRFINDNLYHDVITIYY